MKLLAFVACLFTIFAPSIQRSINETSNVIELAEERTLIILKPDAVQRGLIADVLKRFEAKGMKLIAIKMLLPPREVIEAHYGKLRGKYFFDRAIKYMSSGPIIVTVWEGFNAIEYCKDIKGYTDHPAPGTIRFDFSSVPNRNIIHSSHSPEDAKREIALWFKESELIPWEQASVQFIHGYDFI